MAIRAYPTSKTQTTVLSALNLSAANFTEAERIFEELGLVVTSKRQGRATVPVIRVLDRQGGAFNAHGEGVVFDQYPAADFSAIEQWIE
jgi:hypothetical protein